MQPEEVERVELMREAERSPEDRVSRVVMEEWWEKFLSRPFLVRPGKRSI